MLNRCRYERLALLADDDQVVVIRLLALWRALAASPQLIESDEAVLADDALLNRLADSTMTHAHRRSGRLRLAICGLKSPERVHHGPRGDV